MHFFEFFWYAGIIGIILPHQTFEQMKKTAVILFLIVAANLDMWPQMTLRDCLLYAREHSHANVISRLDVRKAEIDRNLSASDMMPYLGFSTSANLSFGRNIDPKPIHTTTEIAFTVSGCRFPALIRWSCSRQSS